MYRDKFNVNIIIIFNQCPGSMSQFGQLCTTFRGSHHVSLNISRTKREKP